MDTRKDGWFGRLEINGVSEPINIEGTILGITAKMIGELQRLSLRQTQTARTITIQLSDKPITTEVATNLSLVPLTHPGPNEGESYDEFRARLIADGCVESIATFLADDWFEQDKDNSLVQWMNDSKAQRFMQLQASKAEFESALPSEYESLKQYIILTYPERAKQFTFRTA